MTIHDPCYVDDISRNLLGRYFCVTSDTSDKSNTIYTSDTSYIVNSCDLSKTSASVTRL